MARLGVYVDDVYHRDAVGRISTDRAFLLFVCAVAGWFDGALLFGRTVSLEAPADYLIPAEIGLVALPHYAGLENLLAVASAASGTIKAMWTGLERVDVVWIFGPHPFGVVLALLATARGKRVVLGVRHDSLEYARLRLGGSRVKRRMSAVLDSIFRAIARRTSATLVGEEVVGQYGGIGPRNLLMNVSLVPASAVRSIDEPVDPLATPVRLLTVGRLDVEKNPLLVVEMLAELHRRRPGEYRLVWVGRGAMQERVLALAEELGVAALLELRGYVSFGEELFALYREMDMFVHVSHTEGVPQVLIEAMACGTPVVATAVGGVPGLLEHGAAGLLVQPGDRDALVGAVERLRDDPELREQIVRRGLKLAPTLTLEAQSERAARFLRATSGRRPVGSPSPR